MANNNQFELVVTVEVDKANQSIKSVNANLSGIEAAATQVGACRFVWHRRHDGFDGQGRDGWQSARGRDQERHRVREGVDRRGGEGGGAHGARRSLSRARWPRRTATAPPPRRRQLRRSGEVGYATADATTSVQKLIIADIGLDKATSLAKIAKDAAAVTPKAWMPPKRSRSSCWRSRRASLAASGR